MLCQRRVLAEANIIDKDHTFGVDDIASIDMLTRHRFIADPCLDVQNDG